MKFVSINNQSSLSDNRFVSDFPSIRLDSFGNPHISWITKKSGYNEVNYKYYNGSSWQHIVQPNFIKSKDIVFSNNGLILDENDSPIIVSSRKDIEDKSILTISSINFSIWDNVSFNIESEILWNGIFYLENIVHSSSSSSSSSGYDNAHDVYIATYSSDEKIKIYKYSDSLSLISEFSVLISNLSSLRVNVFGDKISFGFIKDQTEIKYNYFNVYSEDWAFDSFMNLSSVNGDNIIDMSINFFDDSTLNIAWASSNSTLSKLQYCLVDQYRVETNSIIETNTASSISFSGFSDGYIFGGYKSICICNKVEGENIKIVAIGTTSALFENDTGTWTKTLIDLNVGLDCNYSNLVSLLDGYGFTKTTFVNNGKVYYYQESDSEGFDIVYPKVIFLNKKRLYISNWNSGKLNNGVNVYDVYDSPVGSYLKDAINPVGIFVSGEDPIFYESSSSSSSSSSERYSTSSSSSEVEISYVLSGWGTKAGYENNPIDGIYVQNPRPGYAGYLKTLNGITNIILAGLSSEDYTLFSIYAEFTEVGSVEAFQTVYQHGQKPLEDPSWVWQCVGDWPNQIGTITKIIRNL